MSLSQDLKKDDLTVLSATRQKKSVGEIAKKDKKQSAKRVITRQFVLHPKEIEWPLLSDEKNLELLQSFAECMKLLKAPISKVSLKEIRLVPKDERKNFRAKHKLEEANRLGLDTTLHSKLRCSLSIGVNCVSKSLESETLSAVLVDPDVNPQIITKLLIPIALAKSVPILAIKSLESTMKTAANIKCIALGFKKNCQEDSHHLNGLLKTIITYSEEYKLLKNQESSSSTSNETPSRSSTYKPAKIRKIVR